MALGCVWRAGVSVIVNEGKGKDSPDALRKESGLEKGSIRPQLLLPQPSSQKMPKSPRTLGILRVSRGIVAPLPPTQL